MTISIIGLGWLGFPLATALKSENYQVKGSTTSEDKLEKIGASGISTTLFKLNPAPNGNTYHSLFDSPILFINIPPARRKYSDAHHPQQIRHLKKLAEEAGVKKILYVSSTSVYPNENQTAKETDPLNQDNTGNPALWEAENILRDNKRYDLTVIRFGGLLGEDRIPGKYFSGKENVNGLAPVNYIHRIDAIRAVQWILKHELWNQTFNIVSPAHPQKKEVFEKNARDMGFSPPKSYQLAGEQNWKKISPDKFLQTGFQFHFPDPLTFTYTKQKP